MRASVRPYAWMRWLYPKAIWRGSPEEPVLFLSFDDGPEPRVTSIVLDILKENQVKANFFCIGKNVRAHPGLFQRIYDEGHLCGNHTERHVNGFHTSTGAYLQDVQACSGIVTSRFFRPPYGRMKISQYRQLCKEYSIVMWDVLSRDYDPKISPEVCKQHVLKNCRNGSILVFHDSIKAAKNMLPVLPEIISTLKTDYRFETLDYIRKQTVIN